MPTLFDSTTVNGLPLKNRRVRSATWEDMADEKGHMTGKLFCVYEELARGGFGLIITGCAFVIQDEQPNSGMPGIYDDGFIPEYRRLTDRVHELGSRIVAQIVYGGPQTTYRSVGPGFSVMIKLDQAPGGPSPPHAS